MNRFISTRLKNDHILSLDRDLLRAIGQQLRPMASTIQHNSATYEKIGFLRMIFRHVNDIQGIVMSHEDLVPVPTAGPIAPIAPITHNTNTPNTQIDKIVYFSSD